MDDLNKEILCFILMMVTSIYTLGTFTFGVYEGWYKPCTYVRIVDFSPPRVVGCFIANPRFQ